MSRADPVTVVVHLAVETLAAVWWPLAWLANDRWRLLGDVADVPLLRTWAFVYACWWIVRSVTFPAYASSFDAWIFSDDRPTHPFDKYFAFASVPDIHVEIEALGTLAVYGGTFVLALRQFGTDAVLGHLSGFAAVTAVAAIAGIPVAKLFGRAASRFV